MKKLVALLLLFFVINDASAQNSFINGLTHEGVDITCDLPGSQQMKNIGSKIDNAGMCVFTSIEHAALYAGLEQMRGFRNWTAANYQGGGWPEKVDQVLADYFAKKKITPVPYLQYEGKDPASILDLCEKTGRMAATTYGYSPRYGQRIQHMVNASMFGPKYGVVLDNNFPGEDRYEWIVRSEFVRRTIYPNKSAWIFVWLSPGPPPSPRNLKGVQP